MRHLFQLFTLSWLCVFLAGCAQPLSPPLPTNAGDAGAAAALDNSTTSAGQVTLMITGEPAEETAYRQVVDAFTQKHPAVTVEMVNIPNAGDYRKRLAADFAAGVPADVTLINYRRYAQFAAKGILEPVGPYLTQSSVIQEGDFYEPALAPFYWQGTLICIPQNLSSLVVYYNKTLFDEAGVPYPKDDWTWDDFLQTAQRLTLDSNGDGKTDIYGLGTEASIFRVAPFIWMNGGDLVDNPEKPTALALDTAETREALQWFIDLLMTHHVVPSAAEEQAENSESRFINGRLGMFFNSRRGVPTYRTIDNFDWDVAPLPQGKSKATILHADAFCLSAASQNKMAAWKLIEFANSPEGQTILAQSGRTVPSLKVVAESPAFLDPQAKPQHSRVFLDSIPYLRSVPVIANWVDIETAMSIEFELAFHGDSTLDAAIDGAIVRTLEFFR